MLKAQLLLVQRKQSRAPSLIKWQRLFFAGASGWVPLIARLSIHDPVMPNHDANDPIDITE